MRLYTEISKGVVRSVHSAESIPVFSEASGIVVVDVTDIEPRPAYGWVHNGGTSFSAPAPGSQRPIQNFDLWDRFTTDEKAALRASANETVKGALRYLRNNAVLFLDESKVVNAINGLESAGFIGPGRSAEILQ